MDGAQPHDFPDPVQHTGGDIVGDVNENSGLNALHKAAAYTFGGLIVAMLGFLGMMNLNVRDRVAEVDKTVAVGFEKTNGKVDAVQGDVTDVQRDVADLKQRVTKLEESRRGR